MRVQPLPQLRQKASQKATVALYTPEQRQRRDASPWTQVQGALAALQFLVFLASLALVLRFLFSGQGEGLAIASVLLKTLLLLTIMVTGSIWEKVVFGQWLFAPAFFWEDMVSMAVIALHLTYVLALMMGWQGRPLAYLALAAYAVYAINAAQFLWKLRLARLQGAVAAARVSLPEDVAVEAAR
jgi:3-vinyl bacteriochlorophyllide hydratase